MGEVIGGPLLTVMMIARDEAAVIGRAVESVRGVAEEVVVVDTGSVDRTREVAAAAGAKVFDFRWMDDFSAARNYGLERSHGKWLMVMDADEELLAESEGALREALGNEGALGYWVTLRNLRQAGKEGEFTEMKSLRILRHLEGVKFVGRIHEHPEPGVEELVKRTGKGILESGVVLRHSGFVSGLREKKLRRSVGLLRRELEDRPGQLYYMIEYGRTLMELGDGSGMKVLVEAARMVWERREEARAPMASVALLLEYVLLGVERGIEEGPLRGEEASALAEKWFPRSAPLMWMRANRDFVEGKYAEAASDYLRLIEMGKTGEYEKAIDFDSRIFRGDAVLNLGACYLKMQEIGKAEECFRRVKGDERVEEAARMNLEILTELKRTTG